MESVRKEGCEGGEDVREGGCEGGEDVKVRQG